MFGEGTAYVTRVPCGGGFQVGVAIEGAGMRERLTEESVGRRPVENAGLRSDTHAIARFLRACNISPSPSQSSTIGGRSLGSSSPSWSSVNPNFEKLHG